MARPELLLVSLFLFSLPLYPPNARYILGLGAGSAFANAFMIGAFGAVACACVVTLVYSARHLAWLGFQRRGVIVSTAIYGCSVAALWAAVLLGSDSPVAGAAIGVALGLSLGPIICQWIQVFGHSFRTAVFYGGAAVAIMSALYYLLNWLSAWVAAVLSALAAFVGAFAAIFLDAPDYGIYLVTHDAAELTMRQVLAELRSYMGVVGLPVFGLLVCCLTLSMYTYSNGAGMSTELVGSLLAAIMAMLAAVLVRRAPFVVFVELVFLPIVMAISLFLGAQTPGSALFMVGLFTVNGPLFFVVIYALAAMVTAINSGDFPLPFIFAAAMLCVAVVAAAGYTISLQIEAEALAGTILWMSVAILAVICIIRAAVLFYRQIVAPESQEEASGSAAKADGAEAANGDAAPAPADLAALQAEAIARIAEEHALSKRETEVFDLMARGYGSTFIAQNLFISDNTARTHVRNIYRKLGVGSRTELLSLLNR